MASGLRKADRVLGVAVAARFVLFSFTSDVVPQIALIAMHQPSINLEL